MKTLFEWLIEKFPTASRTNLREMVRDGRVTLNGNAANDVKQPVGPADKVEVLARANAKRPGPEPDELPFDVVYEDDDLIVILKPPGLLTSTNERERRPTVARILENYVTAREPRAIVGIIHRLDRDASGLLVFSKRPSAYYALKKQFYHHTVERIYLAVVEGHVSPRNGRMETDLDERADGRVGKAGEDAKGQVAVTDYETLAEQPGMTLVRVKLHTGRKHQIRAQFAERRNPVLGDKMYGARSPDRRSREAKVREPRRPRPAGQTRLPRTGLMLCAIVLGFDHPATGERKRFEIPAPIAMAQLFPKELKR